MYIFFYNEVHVLYNLLQSALIITRRSESTTSYRVIVRRVIVNVLQYVSPCSSGAVISLGVQNFES